MAIWRVTVFLILAIAFQAMCQDCGEVGNTGDDNAGCPQPELGIDISQNFCVNVYKAIESYFQVDDQRCIVLHKEFGKDSRGRALCNKTVRKLKNESRRTDVNATIHDVFCDGPVRGFTATLNSNGLKWVCGRHKRVRIGSVSLDRPFTIAPPPISVDESELEE